MARSNGSWAQALGSKTSDRAPRQPQSKSHLPRVRLRFSSKNLIRSRSPPYANITITTSTTTAYERSIERSYEVDAEQPSTTPTQVYSKVWCPVNLRFKPCSSSMPDDLVLAQPATGTEERTTTASVTATSHHEMTITTTATSHHEMTDTETVTVTSHQQPTSALATSVPALLPSTLKSVPVAAIAAPAALAALIALLVLPCCLRRFTPRLWSRLDRVLPLEDAYGGVAAFWARLKLTRQRNREVRARTASSGGAILTGDGRGSGWGTWSEKGDQEGSDNGGEGRGMLGRWRERQEEKLRQVDARRAREERWGLRAPTAVGGMVGSSSVRSFENVRRDELRRAKEEKGVVAQ